MEIAIALKTQWELGEDYAVAHTQAFCSFKTLSRFCPSQSTLSLFVTIPGFPHTLFATIPLILIHGSVHMCVDNMKL